MIHNHEVPGSIPGPATEKSALNIFKALFFYLHRMIKLEKVGITGINSYICGRIKKPLAQGSTLLPTALIIVRLKAYHYDDQENFSYKVNEFTSIVKAKEVKCVEKISNEKFKVSVGYIR